MPSGHQDYDPAGNLIIFDEPSHKYFTPILDDPAKTEWTYISVTQFIKQYTPEFDPDGKIARMVAARNGKTEAQVRANWKAKADNACRIGTRVHEVCEDVLLARDIRNAPADEHERLLMANAFDAASKLRDSYQIAGVEKIVFDIELGIAGTIDCLARTGENGYLIADWKTNERIDRANKYGNKMLFDFAAFDDCAYWHYAGQLCTYEMILRHRGYIPAGAIVERSLFHITENSVERIDLPDIGLVVRDAWINRLLTKIHVPF